MENKHNKEYNGRYTRQIPLIGENGQDILSESKILVAGAGGLGSAIAIYLAYAGIGHIRIVDYDIVEETNLNRQILYSCSDIGRNKTDAAKERILGINPHISVDAVNEEISKDNVSSLMKGADIVIDGMDNFRTRYILNSAAIENDLPFIHGAVNGFYGQAATIIPKKTSCLRCIIANPPENIKFPVMGVTCGVIGSIQVTEAIKYLTHKGSLLADRLLMWDGLRCEAESVSVKRSRGCPDCSIRRE